MNIVHPVTAIPSDLIGYFPSSCPSGWAEYTGARGRYIVGTPSGGDMGDTVGTALTNKESRVSGQHTHTFSGSALATHTHSFSGSALGTHNHTQNAHSHTIPTGADASPSTSNYSGATGSYSDGSTASTTATNIAISAGTPAGSNASVTGGTPAGTNSTIGSVANTNAPYIQLICCKKN